ncbi:MAG TPA: hypothetical protein VGK23_01195 [Methanomassiliicoccales archaeon]|jgi:hypothetical protein
MGHGSDKRRLAATVVALAIFLMLTSFFGDYLITADAKAGGLDVEWKVPLTEGFDEMFTAPDGSIIVKEDGGLIRDIDRNGTVKWAYDTPLGRDLQIGMDGHIYLIEARPDSNNSIVCLLINGSLNWRFETDRLLQNIQIGQDGNIYFVEDIGTNSTLFCLTPDGTVAWGYVPVHRNLHNYPFVTLRDGNVMFRETVSEWNNTVRSEGSMVPSYDHLVSISANGKVVWDKDLLPMTQNLTMCDGPSVIGNDTLQFTLFFNDSKMQVGMDGDGSLIWSVTNSLMVIPAILGPNNTAYSLEVFQDQRWGLPSYPVSRINSQNTSTGILNYQKTFDGFAIGPLAMSDNASLFSIFGKMVKLGSDGSVLWNSSDWNLFSLNRILDDDGNCGLLVADESLITLIDGNGVQRWQYRLDSTVDAGHLRPDGSVIVMTDEYAMSIDRPVLTTTMNYFAVLLAIDLFVTLTTLVRIVDMIWPSKTRTD